MIKFITSETPETKYSFGKVEINQFFIDEDNNLCQKETFASYVVLANEDGNPYCYFVSNMKADEPINKILPKVSKIEF